MTNGEIISLARYIIHDVEEPYRYSNRQLLAYLSDGLLVVRRYRPDLFMGGLDEPVPIYTDEDDLDRDPPIIAEYHSALAHYIVALVQATEDEGAHLERLNQMLMHFMQLLRAR